MSTLKLSSFQHVIFWGPSYNKPESFKYTVHHQGTTCAGRTCITYNYTYCFKEKCMVLAFSQVGDLWIVWNSDCRTLHEHLFAKQEHSIEQEHVHLAPKSCPQLWVWSCEWAVVVKNTSTAERRNTQSTKIANSKTSFCVKSCASQAVQGPKDRTETFFPWVGVRNRTKQFLKVLKRSLTFLFLLCEFQVQSCSCSVHVTYTFCSCCVHFQKRMEPMPHSARHTAQKNYHACSQFICALIFWFQEWKKTYMPKKNWCTFGANCTICSANCTMTIAHFWCKLHRS